MHARFAHEHDGAESLLSLAKAGSDQAEGASKVDTAEGRAMSDGLEGGKDSSTASLRYSPSDISGAGSRSYSPDGVAPTNGDRLAAAAAAIPVTVRPSVGPKRKRHWGSNRPPRASPPPKKVRSVDQKAPKHCTAPSMEETAVNAAALVMMESEDEGDDSEMDEGCEECVGAKTAHTTDCSDGFKMADHN